MQSVNIAFTGGGTGGHIYPNLAIIEDWHALNPKDKIFYFGHPEKLEAKLLESSELKDFEGINFKDYLNFVPVESEPLVKTFNPFKLLAWLRRFQNYTKAAKKALKEKSIDLVFGTGGYAAGPVFAACKKLKIPYIIHNLDAHMGLANRAFVKNASALTLGVCDLKIQPKSKKVFLTGNPISKKFTLTLNQVQKTEDKKIKILITGGSQGAQSINDAIAELLDELADLEVEIIHVTGKKNYEEHKKKITKDYKFYKVLDYSHEMPQLCAWADIAICRSGAMTVAEILASQTLAIFIPLPWAAHDHQTKNAQAISDTGAAICLDQDQGDLKEVILDIVKKACTDSSFLDEYKEKMNELPLKNSNEDLLKIIKAELENASIYNL